MRGEARTNNVSERWHNRFRLIIGKHHPDLYSALKEFQKEQGDAEISVVELSLARKIECGPKKNRIDSQNRIHDIVQSYDTYAMERVTEYLLALSYYIVI